MAAAPENGEARSLPMNGVAGWVDARLPVISAFQREYVHYPTPRNLNALWNFGAFAVVVLAVMIATGLFLAINYTATTAGAFASIEFIDRQLDSGWILRFTHMAGASLFFAVLYVHIFRGLYYGSYKAPRELLWLFGMTLMVLVMGTAFCGYVLPWGQMSYWGAEVVGNAVSSVPWIGGRLARLLQGGAALGDAALHRFFILHMVLAACTIGLVGLHVAALHVAGPNNPDGVPARGPRDTVPFHPYYTSKDGLGLCLFLIVFAVLVCYLPDWLTARENYIPADPLATPADITPEWYFTPFYALLRSVPSRFGGVVLAGGSVALLFLMPWLDRAPVRSARYRPRYRLLMALLVAAFVLLGIAGSHHPEGVWLWVSRLAGLYWFAHFLLLVPLAARYERTLTLPEALVR